MPDKFTNQTIGKVTYLNKEDMPNLSERAKAFARKHAVKLGAVAAAGAVVAAGMITSPDAPSVPKKAEHSIAYLNKDEQETGVKVRSGDNAEAIVQTVNGGRLSGQVLIDAENFVNGQGLFAEEGSDGEMHHALEEGQTVHVPVVSEQQARDVNSGKI